MDSLLTPELIIAWAIQQWLVARKSVRDVNGVFIFSYELQSVIDVLSISRSRVDNDSRILCQYGRLFASGVS